MKHLIIIFTLSLLSGCFGSTIRVDAEPVEELIVSHPAPPDVLVMRDVKWRVLNREQMLALLAKEDTEFPFFAVTDQGYENLSLNMQEITRYISEQKEIIIYYRKLFPNKKLTEGEPDKE